MVTNSYQATKWTCYNFTRTRSMPAAFRRPSARSTSSFQATPTAGIKTNLGRRPVSAVSPLCPLRRQDGA